MNFVAIIAIVLVVIVAGILVYAATRPDDFRIARSTGIKAAPDKIFALINDYRSWPAWSPYEKKDPAMKRTFSGPEKGRGAIYEWDGNKNVGKGRMEIVDTAPPAKITLKLDFERPFEGHNIVEFKMEPAGDATKVTWAMEGRCNFMAKLMGVFINIDKMAGGDFEIGLANLKTVAEK